MTKSTAVTSKAEAKRKVVELIVSRASEDPAAGRALRAARRVHGGEKAPPAYRAGIALADAVARRWLAADNVSALAFAFTGQTDPSLRHGNGITLKTPKRARARQ